MKVGTANRSSTTLGQLKSILPAVVRIDLDRPGNRAIRCGGQEFIWGFGESR